MLAKRRLMLRSLRAVALKALRLVAVLVLLTGIAQAGTRYFYCPLMDVVLSASCCENDERPGDQPELHRTNCCEAKTIGSLPAGAVSTPPRNLVASLVAILPPLQLAYTQTLLPPHKARFSYPMRSSPPAASAARAELMVFLI